MCVYAVDQIKLIQFQPGFHCRPRRRGHGHPEDLFEVMRRGGGRDRMDGKEIVKGEEKTGKGGRKGKRRKDERERKGHKARRLLVNSMR